MDIKSKSQVEYRLVVKPCDDITHDGWIEIVEDNTLAACEIRAISNIQKAIEQPNCKLYIEYAEKIN